VGRDKRNSKCPKEGGTSVGIEVGGEKKKGVIRLLVS